MLRDYFQGEVDYLQQLLDELGESFPRLAPIVGRGADAGIARLVQSMGFVFGRLRERLDDDGPEIIHPLVDHLYPELLRPLPSATIVELAPAGLTTRFLVPQGTAFGSRAVDDTSCTFQTSLDCVVQPWSLRRVEVVGRARLELRLELEASPRAKLSFAADEVLKLFIGGPLGPAFDLRAHLLRHATGARARVDGRAWDLVDAAERPFAAADLDASMLPLPSPGDGLGAFLRLREYFAFPERFAFLSLRGLGRLAEAPPSARIFELLVTLDEPLPVAAEPSLAAMRVHCVPAVNVYAPERVVLKPSAAGRADVVLSERGPAVAEVYAVTQVGVVERGYAEPRSATPYAALEPPRPEDVDESDGRDTRLFFAVERTPTVAGSHLDVSVRLVDAGGGRALGADASLVVELLATNGALAHRLAEGDVGADIGASSNLVSARNVSGVSRSLAPVCEGDRLWEAFGLAKQQLAWVATTDALGRAIALANLPAWAQHPNAKPGRDRFEPLGDVELARGDVIEQGRVTRGAVVTVSLDARPFASEGDRSLFGELLHAFLASLTCASEWVELHVRDPDGRDVAAYPPRAGTRSAL